MEFNCPLPKGWKWVPLGELADPKGRAIVSGPFGSNISSKFFVDEGIPVIRGNNLTTGSQKFVDDGFVFVTPEKAKELGNVDAVSDDIIFTAAGSLGQVGIIPVRTRFSLYIISNKQMRVRLNRDLIDPLFAFQWLSSSAMVTHIQQQNTGSSVPLINLSIVRRLQVPLPPLAEQKAITAVLGALDDKMELNRQMNATLEAMARALFQSWFVDFAPVRAKLDGHPPYGLDEATAALFPRSFHETKLGHIPLGWQAGRLADLCNLKRGHDLPTNTRTAGAIPVISSSGISGSHSETNVRGPGVVTGRYGTIGKVFYVETDYWPLNTTLYVDDFKGSPPRFIFHALGEVDFSNYTDKAAVPGVNRNHLHEEPTVLPPMEVRDAFARIVAPLWSEHAANERQSRTLATLRDTLLPKLLSGELKAIG